MKPTSQPSSTRNLWLVLANLNPFGIGYLLSNQKKRWLIFLVGSILLVIAAQVLNASRMPVIWAGVFIAWFLVMAVDLWLLLKRKAWTPSGLIEKSPALLPIFAVLITVLFYGGFFLYRQAGTNIYQTGVKSYEIGDYDTSVKSLTSFSSRYRLTLNPDMLAVPGMLDENEKLITIRDQVNASEFEKALHSIIEYKSLYPKSTKLEELSILAVDSYLGWVDELIVQKEFETGLEKMSELRSGYPPATSEDDKEYQAKDAALYIAWGNDLRGQSHFLQAIEKYELAKTYTDSNTTLTEIEQETGTAMQLLAIDSGEDGKKILEQTMAEACYQEILPTSPVVGSLKDEKGTILICDFSEGYAGMTGVPGFEPGFVENMLLAQAGIDWLPSDLTATSPGSLRFVVARLDDYQATKTCDYTGPMGLTDQFSVMRQTSTIMIRDIFSNKVIAEKVFYADNPNYQCPKTKPYLQDSYYFGELVDNQKIIAWLRQVIEDYLK
ncbi:MAG: sulfite exporter TauE/SafE family protein [Anaerolineaceae bacterium]